VAENVSSWSAADGEAPWLSRRVPALVTALLFALLCAAPATAQQTIAGTVFEDVNYGGGAGRSLAASSGSPRPNARVEIYRLVGATYTYLAAVTTDASGNYTFSYGVGQYMVRVVNSTVTSSRGVGAVLPVQTFRTDASTGSVVPVVDYVGGQNPAVADAGNGVLGPPAAAMDANGVFTGGTGLVGLTAQSIAPVGLQPSGSGVTGVDFGFNFDTVVNVNSAGQGSLRQFILNSNALGNATPPLAIVGQPAGRDVSIFMISDGLAHAGLRTGITNLLSAAGVAVITPAPALPAITDAATSVDGTTQTANVGNTNTVVLGTGGTVGVDGLALSQMAGPEVEIVGGGMNASGLLIQAANAVVRGLAIHGFGNAADQAGVRVDAFSGALIENNVLGSTATSFTDPGAGQRNQGGVYSGGGTNGTVRSNLIGFGRVTGIRLAFGATGWTITGNEIRDSGTETTNGDGLDVNASPTNTFVGNLVTGTSSQGIVLTAPASGNVFTNNTVTGNGVGIASGFVQSTGITIRTGIASTLLDRNVIRANYGAGVQVNDGATGTRMRRNSFALNGTITARNGGAATGQIGIDLNAPADNIDLGTAPFYTLNDLGDTDTGGNGLLNFPVLTSAVLSGGSLILHGFARPGSVIELFIASPSPDPTGFGEGTTWVITLTEGGTGAGGDDPYADLNAGTGTYGPGAVNGIAQGTDTTNRFTFMVPAPGGVGVGTPLTATATLGGATSEFSGNVIVAATTVVTLQSFEAVGRDGAIDLRWTTASELDNLGFNVYRGPSSNGPWTKLNATIIPGLGSSAVGQVYTWHDAGLVNGNVYYYRLEDIDTHSVSTFHGPVWATPTAATTPEPPPSHGKGAKTDSVGQACPSWVWTAYGSSAPSTDRTGPSCTRYGDPEATSLEEVSRTGNQVTLELRTAGFYAVREASGAVRAFIPGFDLPSEPAAPALPLRRALVDAVVGRSVRLGAVEALDRVGFPGLVAARTGRAEMVVLRDGTVRAAHRAVPPRRDGRGPLAREVARLSGVAFLGETKTATVELSPLAVDPVRGQLVLFRLVRLKLVFIGQEPDERGSGNRGRRRPQAQSGGTKDDSVLAQLFTARHGLYAVPFEALVPGSRRPLPLASLRLQRQSAPVAYHVEPAGTDFGPGSVLYFYADTEAASTAFTGETAYELVRGGGGVRMGLGSAAPAGPALLSPPSVVSSFETNRFYQPGLLEAPDPWLWDVVASGGTASESFTLACVDPSRPAALTAFLQGASESGTEVDYHLRVAVNGLDVGETSFAGKVPARVDAVVPAGVLREGTNVLALTSVADTGVYSIVFLDRFTLACPQVAAASGGRLEASWSETGTASVSGIAAPAVVLDVTEPTAPRWLSGFAAMPDALRFGATAGSRYLLAGAPGLFAPRVAIPAFSSLRDATNQADYLLVAPAAFLPAAQPLLDRREGEGLATKAVSLEEIASVFGHGQPSAEAIHDFLAYAYHSWSQPSPRYVLLLGDSSSDPRNFTGRSGPAPLPFLAVPTSFLWTASDPLLAAVNGDDTLPDLALGRLPASTVEQAQAMVAKLLDWEDSGQGFDSRAVLVADNPDAGGDFDADVDEIAASFLAAHETAVIKISRLGAAARPAVLDAWNAGASLVSYVGHGAAATWASENVLNSFDVPALLAQSRQPLLLTWNCLNGYFVAPSYDALAEALVKAPGRGAIAAVSPTGLSLDGPAQVFHRALMAEVTSGRHRRLGDAFFAAQQDYARSGEMPELVSVYHLFGDPAMPIH
jgi:parallel beta-helix repeat protein